MDEPSIIRAVQCVLNSREDFHVSRNLEGGDHEVWYVGNEFVFRSTSSSTENVEIFRRETCARDLIKKKCESGSFIPEVIATGFVPEYQRVFNIETRYKGKCLENCRPTLQTEQDLTNMLGVLSKVPVCAALDSGIPKGATEDLQGLLKEAYVAWAELISSGHVQSSNKQQLEEAFGEALRIQGIFNPGSLRLLHGDLKGEHIFVHNEAGRLEGIIDWSDVRVGEVAVDLAGLAISVGQGMMQRIGLNLGTESSTLARASLLSQCYSIVLLRDRFLRDDDSPAALLRRQFRRAFELTKISSAFDHMELDDYD